jgi:DNA sulfur modification protein DndE
MDHVNIFNEWWAQNGDGVDISACRNVILYRCTVSAGDDGICMKSSDGSKQGDKDGAALENVLIAGCTVYHAHGGFVIGSNTDGGMHNISVSDCSFIGTDVGLRFKSNMGRGGLVNNIFIQDIVMRDIATYAIVFDTYYENMPAGYVRDPNQPKPQDKTPEFRDFHISRIYCSGAQTAISITGLPQMPIRDIHFDTVEISAEKGLVATQARGIDLHAVKLITVQQPVMQADQTAEVRVR